MAKATVKLTNGVSWGAILTPDAEAISDGSITISFVGTGNAVDYPLAVVATQVASDKTVTPLYADVSTNGIATIEGTFVDGDKVIVIAQRAVEVTSEADA